MLAGTFAAFVLVMNEVKTFVFARQLEVLRDGVELFVGGLSEEESLRLVSISTEQPFKTGGLGEREDVQQMRGLGSLKETTYPGAVTGRIAREIEYDGAACA
jgi:hypothetical protein